jgi:fluoroquinolone resistance protein
MAILAYENQTFEKADYSGKAIKGREFIECTFENCNCANSDFSGNKFIDCTFRACNLSMIKFAGAALFNAIFKDCKILGVNFSETQEMLFKIDFESCILDYCSFMGKKMPKTNFTRCSLKEANFIQSNISGSVFDQSDLSGAVFNETDLTSANFVTAFNYAIDPELNKVRKASFSGQGLAGLLNKYKINIV